MSGASLGQIQLEIDGEGPPIVFLHGLGRDLELIPAAAQFARRLPLHPPRSAGRRAIAAPFAKITIDALVEAVRDISEDVAGAPAHLVAHSMGTLVALHVAASAPDAVLSLTLFGPIGEPGDAARERLRDRAAPRPAERHDRRRRRRSRRRGFRRRRSPPIPSLVAYVRESHLRQDAEGFAQSCEALAGARRRRPSPLRRPTLLVTGEDDPIAPPTAAQGLADAIRGAKVRILAALRPLDAARAAEGMRAAGFRAYPGARVLRNRSRRLKSGDDKGGAAMADDRIGGSNGVVFTNVRILDGSGEYPYTRRGRRPGQPHPAGDQGRVPPFARARAPAAGRQSSTGWARP